MWFQKRARNFISEVVRTFDGKSRLLQGSGAISEVNEHPEEMTWRSRRIKDGKVIDERTAVLDSTSKIQTVQRTTFTDAGEIMKEVLVSRSNRELTTAFQTPQGPVGPIQGNKAEMSKHQDSALRRCLIC